MLPTNAQDRKDTPIASGVLDYFPDALAEIARVSKKGNDQHNPGQPLHWDKSKSTDHSDALIRHFMERGDVDSDGMLHSAKVAWRALALLQEELEMLAAHDAVEDEYLKENDPNYPSYGAVPNPRFGKFAVYDDDVTPVSLPTENGPYPRYIPDGTF